jgi:hypothetical protein
VLSTGRPRVPVFFLESTFIDQNNPKRQTADPLWGSAKLGYRSCPAGGTSLRKHGMAGLGHAVALPVRQPGTMTTTPYHRLCPYDSTQYTHGSSVEPSRNVKESSLVPSRVQIAFGTLLSRSAKVVSRDPASAVGAVGPTFNMAK